MVSAKLRGRGIGRALYNTLFSRAAAKGHAQVVCEINLEPPNPGSDTFHMAMGFESDWPSVATRPQQNGALFRIHTERGQP